MALFDRNRKTNTGFDSVDCFNSHSLLFLIPGTKCRSQIPEKPFSNVNLTSKKTPMGCLENEQGEKRRGDD